MTIVGDSGISKSRLARELVHSVDEDAAVVVASCPPYGEGTTFSPIREAFRQACRDESVLEGSSYEVFAATSRVVRRGRGLARTVRGGGGAGAAHRCRSARA
jgi:predicted ATPase